MRDSGALFREVEPAKKTGPDFPSVPLRYMESSPILVKGPITGRQYEFSEAHPIQSVHVGDAEALLQTRFFRKVF